jgi:MFS family permease
MAWRARNYYPKAVDKGRLSSTDSLGFRAKAMITIFILVLVLAFSPAAVWALRVGGLRRLWMLCALVLLAVLLLALLLSAVYSVPSAWRVILYFLAFVGPSMLFATSSLTLANGFARRTLPVELITAFAGSMIGLAVGFIVVVYVLGVW